MASSVDLYANCVGLGRGGVSFDVCKDQMLKAPHYNGREGIWMIVIQGLDGCLLRDRNNGAGFQAHWDFGLF